MILATELRIGNLFKGIAGIQTVFAIEDNTERGKYNMDQYNGYSHLILCKENGNQYKPWEIEPIPLTEEWLLKFGAKELEPKRGVLKEFVLKTVRIEISNSHNFYYKNSKVIISSVHQLQNLFYALTGQELTLKQ